jgi:hypothetical protein
MVGSIKTHVIRAVVVVIALLEPKPHLREAVGVDHLRVDVLRVYGKIPALLFDECSIRKSHIWVKVFEVKPFSVKYAAYVNIYDDLAERPKWVGALPRTPRELEHRRLDNCTISHRPQVRVERYDAPKLVVFRAVAKPQPRAAARVVFEQGA